jgi:antitoxin component YwqK of YwqJK toxin-antitoxin module
MLIRSVLLAAMLLLGGIQTIAQVIVDEEGLYYDEENKLYTGTYIEFHNNGNKKIEVSLKSGLPDGPLSIFFESGKIHETRSYKKGKMHGTWLTWNEDGTKVALANYKDNLKHGDWFIWDDKGTLRFEMHYSQGKKVGTWKMFNEKGELVSEEEKKDN